MSYAFDRDAGGDPAAAPAADSPEFWQKMQATFDNILEMVRDMAREYGVNLEALDSEEIKREQERERDAVKARPLVQAAMDYARQVNAWFEQEIDGMVRYGKEMVKLVEMGAGDGAPRARVIAMQSAVESIRWYQHLIGAKLSRGYHGRLTDDEAAADARQRDSDGSVKVALMAIDRSIESWNVIGQLFPDKWDDLLTLLAALERLRKGAEQEFPAARAFVRPGFDTVDRVRRRRPARKPAKPAAGKPPVSSPEP